MTFIIYNYVYIDSRLCLHLVEPAIENINRSWTRERRIVRTKERERERKKEKERKRIKNDPMKLQSIDKLTPIHSCLLVNKTAERTTIIYTTITTTNTTTVIKISKRTSISSHKQIQPTKERLTTAIATHITSHASNCTLVV